MSRIADVLRKAREEDSKRPHAQPAPGALAPRPIADVPIPWSLEEAPTPAPPASSEFYRTRADTQRAPILRAPERVQRPSPASGESIGSLARGLFLAPPQGLSAVRRALFTSLDDSPGSGDIAARVAEALAAQSDGSVCLADLDVGRPTLQHRFQLAGRTGLSDAVRLPGPLRGCTHRVPAVANLWVLPAGLPMVDGVPLLRDHATRQRLAQLLDTFDYVVAHTASLGPHPYATDLGPVFDGVVLVVDAHAAAADSLRNATDLLTRAHVRLLGTVVDNRSGMAPQPQ